MINTLKEYFSGLCIDEEQISYYKSEGASRLDLIEMAIDSYEEDKILLKDISLVNMFPRTEHIETIVKLEKGE